MLSSHGKRFSFFANAHSKNLANIKAKEIIMITAPLCGFVLGVLIYNWKGNQLMHYLHLL